MCAVLGGRREGQEVKNVREIWYAFNLHGASAEAGPESCFRKTF